MGISTTSAIDLVNTLAYRLFEGDEDFEEGICDEVEMSSPAGKAGADRCCSEEGCLALSSIP